MIIAPPACVFGAVALVASSLTLNTAPFNASVVDGVLSGVPGAPTPCFLGNGTSGLSSALAAHFQSLTQSTQVPVKNSSFYAYLVVSGSYVGDAPIQLPPGVALVFQDVVITVDAAFPSDAAIVNATNAPWSAVVAPGGPSTAQLICPFGGPSPFGVLAAQSGGFVVDGLSIDGCGGDGGSAIHVRGQPFATGGEVANCLVTNSPLRGIWIETITGVAIHGNTLFNTSKHSIDFDAYSASSIAFNNSVSFSVEEAVFIEQGASNIVVVDNDLGPGQSCGVAVYNNAFSSPTAGHVIARNRIVGSSECAVGVGSGPGQGHAEAVGVIIAGNTFSAVNGTGFHVSGYLQGTLLFANAASGTQVSSSLQQSNYRNVSATDPIDRVNIA